MKKYKLIKKLPFENSPEIGYISKPTIQKDYAHYWNHNWFQPEDYPEFWEKVVEKDYKILSLARLCSIKPTITDVSNYGDGYIEALLKCDKARIHSVKRLSDGEIFTIGDKVQDSLTDRLTNFKVQTITYFNIGDKLICNAESGSTMPLNTIRKAKLPLFTTEDGVGIFKNDIVWHAYLNHNVTPFSTVVNETKPYTPIRGLFSTRKKAEEYILLNKPVLSLKDISDLSLTSKSMTDLGIKLRKRVQKLIKQN